MAWIGARLAEALDYAFSKDVAHGDVKPSNILLTADGIPMLLDFNLARDGLPLGSIDHVADLGGTVAYMAPERLCLGSGESVRPEMTASDGIVSGSVSAPFHSVVRSVPIHRLICVLIKPISTPSVSSCSRR